MTQREKTWQQSSVATLLHNGFKLYSHLPGSRLPALLPAGSLSEPYYIVSPLGMSIVMMGIPAEITILLRGNYKSRRRYPSGRVPAGNRAFFEVYVLGNDI